MLNIQGETSFIYGYCSNSNIDFPPANVLALPVSGMLFSKKMLDIIIIHAIFVESIQHADKEGDRIPGA